MITKKESHCFWMNASLTPHYSEKYLLVFFSPDVQNHNSFSLVSTVQNNIEIRYLYTSKATIL